MPPRHGKHAQNFPDSLKNVWDASPKVFKGIIRQIFEKLKVMKS